MKIVYPVPDGHRRMWVRCECGCIDFIDYVSSGMLRLPAISCGHTDYATINVDDALPHLLAEAFIGKIIGTPSKLFRQGAVAA
jgi:hypothetical protein